MTKTVKIKSRKTYLFDTPADIILETYEYCPAAQAVAIFTKAASIYNNGKAPELIIRIVVKHTDKTQAKIKLKGERNSIYSFINRLIAETILLDKFDIKI